MATILTPPGRAHVLERRPHVLERFLPPWTPILECRPSARAGPRRLAVARAGHCRSLFSCEEENVLGKKAQKKKENIIFFITSCIDL
jgi:hypothetical protein